MPSGKLGARTFRHGTGEYSLFIYTHVIAVFSIVRNGRSPRILRLSTIVISHHLTTAMIDKSDDNRYEIVIITVLHAG